MARPERSTRRVADPEHVMLRELARRQGVRPVRSADDLAADGAASAVGSVVDVGASGSAVSHVPAARGRDGGQSEGHADSVPAVTVRLGHHGDGADGGEESDQGPYPSRGEVEAGRLGDGPLRGHIAGLPHGGRLLLRFGEQVDVQVIGAAASGELIPERVPAYPARYATRSAQDFGLGEGRLPGPVGGWT